jgi:hypothetical protein
MERSVKEFLAERFKSLAIEDASPALYQQAAQLRRALGVVATLAWAVGIFSLLAMLITSFAVADAWSAHKGSAEFMAYCAMLIFWMTLVVICLRAGKIIVTAHPRPGLWAGAWEGLGLAMRCGI